MLKVLNLDKLTILELFESVGAAYLDWSGATGEDFKPKNEAIYGAIRAAYLVKVTTVDTHHDELRHYIDEYFKLTGEDPQDYINEVLRITKIREENSV